MKTLFILIFSTVTIVSAHSQTTYEKAMQNAVDKLNNAQYLSDFTDVANTFERISMNETDKWLPFYYAAYSCIVISFQEQDKTKKENYNEQAQQFIDKALEIAPEESEIHALQAFLYPAVIMTDPMSLGPVYMEKMNRSLEKAIELNPENPRSYYLRAITVLNMPENFGGGARVAKPIFEQAQEKFETFKPETSISPNWGKEQNEQELSKL